MAKLHDRVLARLFRGGWAARIAYRIGLHGRLAVRDERFTLPRARDAAPLRVAFASDFHAGPTTDPRLIEQACRALADARADLVLLGGDFVNWFASDVATVADLLSAVRAPLGVYAVLGNHDLVTDGAVVARALRDAGVELLTNRGTFLAPPHDDVWLCGLDDPIIGDPRPEDVLRLAAEHEAAGREPAATIVLMHAPDGLLAIGERHFDFAFCGHTHGGQIALPWGVPIIVPRGRLSRRFSRGVYVLRRERRMLVSHGVGCATLPVRLFARPEVHVCTFVARSD